MSKGLMLLVAATEATLGSVAVATPAAAQYHGHDRGWHGGYHHDRRAHWHHERERRWHHRHDHHRGYYGHHYRGY